MINLFNRKYVFNVHKTDFIHKLTSFTNWQGRGLRLVRTEGVSLSSHALLWYLRYILDLTGTIYVKVIPDHMIPRDVDVTWLTRLQSFRLITSLHHTSMHAVVSDECAGELG